MEILELVALNNATPLTEVAEDPAELDALHREQSIRERFRFSLANVPVGATLTFSKDDAITAKVIDDRQIEFEGKITSTSAAALKLLNRAGRTWTAVQGPQYWMYDGEALVDRRRRMEEGAF